MVVTSWHSNYNQIKHLSNSLCNSTMGWPLTWSKLFGLYLSLFGPFSLFPFPFSLSIYIHLLDHLMLPLLNGQYINTSHGLRNIHLKTRISIITMLPKLPFHCLPKDFNEIKLTVVFWKYDANVQLDNSLSFKVQRWNNIKCSKIGIQTRMEKYYKWKISLL